MIVKIIDGNSISVKSEEPDDMVALRRAISVGDRIAGSTSREIKKERESIRPEKGQRVRIRISLESKKIKLEDHIHKTHPYKVPEIASISMTSVNSSYMKWISDSVI